MSVREFAAQAAATPYLPHSAIDQWRGCSVTVTTSNRAVFTVQCYASTVYAVIVCPSVGLSICLSQAGTVPND